MNAPTDGIFRQKTDQRLLGHSFHRRLHHLDFED
jgi:hypothetical protein